MLYELISISCGEATVHYATEDLKDLARRFQAAGTSRIRVDGELLTMSEAYALVGDKLKIADLPARRKKTPKVANARPVEKIDEHGNVLARYPTVSKAADMNYYATHNAITKACKKGVPTKDGLRFRYAVV